MFPVVCLGHERFVRDSRFWFPNEYLGLIVIAITYISIAWYVLFYTRSRVSTTYLSLEPWHPHISIKKKWHISTFHINTKDAVVYQIRISVITCFTIIGNRIGGVMVSVLVSSVVDRGFEPRSGQTKDYKIGIRCFSANHAGLKRKSRDWLACNHDNVSEWRDMFIRGLLFQWTSTIKIQLSGLL